MNEDKIQCQECKKYFGNLGMHLRTHDLTSREYQKKYPGALITSEEYDKKHRENMLARYKNPDANFYKKAGQRTFDFVPNKDLRGKLQRDYRDAKICLENELWKPSIILYGSIIEAILIEKTTAKTFATAIDQALDKKIISEKQYYKIQIVKNLRNFVHIHEELREKEEINDYWARTFGDICESIISYFKT